MESYISYLAALFVTPAQLVVSRKFHHVAIYYCRYRFLLLLNFHVHGARLVSSFHPPEQGGVIFETSKRYVLLRGCVFIATYLGEVGHLVQIDGLCSLCGHGHLGHLLTAFG
jgi:hypothetical protein